jgi:hypothetical protein
MIVDNHFTRQYNPEDSSEHHTRRRENLKSHNSNQVLMVATAIVRNAKEAMVGSGVRSQAVGFVLVHLAGIWL